MTPEPASKSTAGFPHPRPPHRSVSLFTTDRPESAASEQPTVELVEEEAENTKVQPPLKFFDDQCGCN